MSHSAPLDWAVSSAGRGVYGYIYPATYFTSFLPFEFTGGLCFVVTLFALVEKAVAGLWMIAGLTEFTSFPGDFSHGLPFYAAGGYSCRHNS